MTQNTSLETLIQQGHEQLEQEQYEAALEIFQQAVQLETQNPQVLYGLGLTCYRLERYQESVEYLNQALQIQPFYILALARRGMAHRKLKLDEQATADFERAIQIEPQNYEHWRGRGTALYELQQYEEAIACYDTAIEIKPYFHDVWHSKGNALYELGCYEEAITSYDKAIEIKPDFHDAWYNRGAMLCYLGRYEEAITCYDKAIEIKPDSHDAWYQRGSELYNLGHYEEALTNYERTLQLQPDYHDAWHGKGTVLWRLGRHEEALACYNRVLELQPSYHDAWHGKGTVLWKLGRHEEALASYERTLQLQPGYHDAWHGKGAVLWESGDYEEALTCYEHALQLQPDYHDAWNSKGNVLWKLGQLSEALACYDRVLELQPDYYLAWTGKGDSLWKLGQLTEAFICYNRALELQPDYHFAWNGKGNVLWKLGRYEEALACYEHSLELQSDNHIVWTNKGNVLRDLKRHEEALACYERTLQLQPDYHDAWNGKGNVFWDLGRHEEVLACYERTLQLQPDYYLTWNGKGNVLRDLRRHEEALTCYERALQLQPNYHDAWNGKGNVFWDLGRYEEALACYTQVLQLRPDYYLTWNGKGNVLRDLGRYEEALACYTQALHLQPGFHLAWNGKGNVLKDLRRHKEALACYDHALQLTDNQYSLVWANRGWVIFILRGYQAALDNWNQGLQSLQSDKPDYQEGCGMLHCSKGNVHYYYGGTQSNPFPYWREAKRSYRQALDVLTTPQLKHQRLEVFQALIKVCRGLGDDDTAQVLIVEGSELLGRLLQEMPSNTAKIRLSQKFAAFNQYRVDSLVQMGNWCAALDLAEHRKNLCLRWLRYGWSDSADVETKYTLPLPNPQTAAIYWHISPAAITTFILKHNQPPQIHSVQVTADDTTYPPDARQLRDFENWVKDWKENYQNYRSLKEKGTEENLSNSEGKNHPWRQEMTAKLDELKTILDIPGILPHLSNIHQLILIPHRDLHLLPLHYLFREQDFTITYLPSAQIGIDLQQSKTNLGQALLNIENPRNDLRYATLESAAIGLLYPSSNPPIKGENATKPQILTAIKTYEQLGVFHFTGHGEHDINHPLESSLLLAQAEKLTLRDIFELDFRHYHLICLSACETALTSKQGLIDEFVGLISGFLAKGATYVISTLWAVDERSTALLMVRFYQYLQENITPPSALKAAQKWLRTVTHPQLIQWYQNLAAEFEGTNPHIQWDLNSQVRGLQRQINSATINPDQPPYAHPYYWAGFTVTGKV
jgi:tetratricopeptide (TPR) repeat protein